MTGAEGVDALGHPDPAATAKAGERFVAQYLKNLTRTQVDAYHKAGVAVVLLSEQSGRDALNGYAAGLARGKADNIAATALGAPAGTAVYVAEADFEPTPEQLPAIGQYALGHAAGLGSKYRSGFYGGLAAENAALEAGYKGFLFQTYAWSQGKWAPGVTLEQYLNGQTLAGTGVDLDRALVADFGAWAPVDAAAAHARHLAHLRHLAVLAAAALAKHLRHLAHLAHLRRHPNG